MDPQQQKLKIKTYTPESSGYAPRIRNEQWEQHKSTLERLHKEGYKRAAMLDFLRERGFSPSMGQLNARMTAWGFKVYGTQSDAQDQTSMRSLPVPSLDAIDADMADVSEHDVKISPTSHGSISSMTLYDPETQFGAQSGDRLPTLDDIIEGQCLAITRTYWPAIKPSDFGFRSSTNTNGVDKNQYQSIISVADFLYAVHCFEQAFDLYFHVFEHSAIEEFPRNTSLIRGLAQCALSATIESQCAYVASILVPAHAYCVENQMQELATCFEALLQDLNEKEAGNNNLITTSRNKSVADILLLIAMDPKAESEAYGREWLTQQISECDEAHATLVHLSSWCQDVLNFYQIDNRAITRNAFKAGSEIDQLNASEQDFQLYASRLITDYLNSPGPSMRKANVDCKEDDCLFRWALSPTTSLVVMTHLLFEPLRPQAQRMTDRYLQTRARQLATCRTTTGLQELRCFASQDSSTRCNAFVDTFLKHFSTTLTFRRHVSSMRSWDRIAIAKRLAQFLLSNQMSSLPHAGLPGGRRSVMRTLSSPFNHDPILTESRPSVVSESGSMGEFAKLASRIGDVSQATGSQTPSDAMSIDTQSSWSFHRVTGFASGPFSARNSMSSRRGELDEIEEYRSFIKSNNYSQQNLESPPKTPTRRDSTPTMEDR